MKRMRFNSRGQFEGADSELGSYISQEDYAGGEKVHLKKSDELEFLREDGKFEPIVESSSWSLYSNNTFIIVLLTIF